MKNLIRPLILSALAATFTVSASAQTPTSSPAPATGAAATTLSPADEAAKAALYDKWRNNRNGDAAAQKSAYEAGQEYLQKYGADNDVYVKAVQKWVTNYEKATREFEYSVALKDQKYDRAFVLGKEIIALQPERVDIPLVLGWSGYLASTKNNDSFNTEAAAYARQALQRIESGRQPMVLDANGKEVVSWAPFTSREDAIGGLNFALGSFATKLKKPEEAAVYFHKAAQQQTGFTGKEPSTYANLGGAYAQFAEYKKLIQDYQTLVTKDANAAGSDEAKAILARLDPMTDRIIDAYARAIALAGTNANYATAKADWMKRLTDFYKFRNNNADTGLNEFVASVLSKPMPSATETPSATAPAQPSTGGTNNGSATPPASTTPATTPTSTVRPAASTTNNTKPGANSPSATTNNVKP
jgi:hypothetical protein